MGLTDYIPVIGKAVEGIGNVISTSMTNKANKDIMREQNQFNLEQWNREADFTREMWNANNEYNDPKEQMRRLTDAGLSPWAAAQVLGAGDASAVGTPSTSAAQSAQMQAPDFGFLGAASQQVLDNYMATRKKAAEVKEAEANADAARTNADMNAAYYDNYWAKILDANYEGLLFDNSNKKYDSSLKLQSIDQNAGRYLMEQWLQRQQHKLGEQTFEIRNIENIARQVDLEMAKIHLKNLPTQIRSELALRAAEAFAANAAGQKSIAEAKHEFYKQCATIIGASDAHKLSNAVFNDTNMNFLAKYEDYYGVNRHYNRAGKVLGPVLGFFGGLSLGRFGLGAKAAGVKSSARVGNGQFVSFPNIQ